MQQTYSDAQLMHIRDQAMVYQCACPAQVCVAIDSIRSLYQQQLRCLDTTDTDRSVHERIKASAERSHAELEACLTDIIRIEGWDMATLKMPAYLQKRLIDDA
ncbi:MAG: hypothetical protein R6X06_00470 [Gammaproteobacteria bacterium]